MSAPADTEARLAAKLEELDELGRALDVAVERRREADNAYDDAWDTIALELKEAMQDEGRKGDPAEHTIRSETRRRYRAQYREARDAKREQDRIERRIQAVRAEVSGWQSNLGLLRDEAKAQASYDPSPEPAWSGIGGRGEGERF